MLQVKEGQSVRVGRQLDEVGFTGKSTGRIRISRCREDPPGPTPTSRSRGGDEMATGGSQDDEGAK